MKKIRTRFAPSPTGFMHVGNLRTALYKYLFAKQNGGTFILRIEDTDTERYVEGAVDAIYRTLQKAGITLDEGPHEGGEYGPYIQSERFATGIYLKYASELIERGGAYYCFCTKERLESLAAEDKNNIRTYDKYCASLSQDKVKELLDSGTPHVIRQRIPQDTPTVYVDEVFGEINIDSNELEDQILIKSNGMPTYNFANVIDDYTMGITHVMRGVEYLSSTPKYNLLYDSFGWERPTYIHLQLIMRDASTKLSKRHGDANFEDFLAKGYLPHAIVNFIALLGWSPGDDTEKMSMQELIEKFSVKGLSKSPSIFDEVKLRWLNSLYIKELDEQEFFELALPFIERSKARIYCHKKIAKLVKTRIETLSDIPLLMDFLAEYYDKPLDMELFCNQKWKTDEAMAKKILGLYLEKMSDDFDLDEFAAQNGFKKGQVLWCLRIAVTNQASTPGGAMEMIDLLGVDESRRRVERVLSA